tara:strand:+ start:237 stop:467 length:231 start_codon:yes stop_codon:yes gene_type:complete
MSNRQWSGLEGDWNIPTRKEILERELDIKIKVSKSTDFNSLFFRWDVTINGEEIGKVACDSEILEIIDSFLWEMVE